MDKDTLGTGIKRASNSNLIKLVVEHYISKRGGEGEGILSNNELNMAVEEARKRGIAGKIDSILKGEQLVSFGAFDLNLANLRFMTVITFLEHELGKLETIGGIYGKKWLKPKNKDQKEYRDEIIKELNHKGSFLLNSDWVFALELRIKAIKKNIILLTKQEREVGYPIIGKDTKELIEEGRQNIGYFLGMLENPLGSIKNDLGVDREDTHYVIYRLAFHSLPKEEQQELINLYEEVEYDHTYLDDEEKIAGVLNGKTTIDKEGIEKLADLLAKKAYNKYAKEYQLYHYYGPIPLLDIARHYLKGRGIVIEGSTRLDGEKDYKEYSKTEKKIEEALAKYAKEKGKDTGEMLKEGAINYIENGLLEKYLPLVLSNKKELYNKWIKKRDEIKERVAVLIKKGELETEDNGNTIKGPSLFNLKNNPDLLAIIEGEFCEKEFREYIKARGELDKLTDFLTRLSKLVKTHSELTEEQREQWRENTESEGKSIANVVDDIMDNQQARKEGKPEKQVGKIVRERNPFYNIAIEYNGLTDEDFKDIDNILRKNTG